MGKSSDKTKKKLVTMPEGYWDAIERAAAERELTVSAWLRMAARAQLAAIVRRQLPKPRKSGPHPENR